MPEFCTCGAQLPPDARFCHKCGKPQFEYPPPEMLAEAEPPPPPPLPAEAAQAEIGFHNRAAVKIGLIMALLAMIGLLGPAPPAIQAVRFVAVFFLAGFLAVLWYRRRTGQHVSPRAGARLGWMTGIFSFVFVLFILTFVVLVVSSAAGMEVLKEQPAMNDPRFQEAIKLLRDPATVIEWVIVMFLLVTTLPMLGGALGARFSDRKA